MVGSPFLPPSPTSVREDLKEMTVDFDRSEDDLKSLQSGVGQIVGEVLRQLTEDKCALVPTPPLEWTRRPSVFAF